MARQWQDNGKMVRLLARLHDAIDIDASVHRQEWRGTRGYRTRDTHTLVNSLHVLHHLIESAHEVGAVDLGQGGVVPAQGFRLVDELLPAGVAGEQGPLFPPVEKQIDRDDEITGRAGEGEEEGGGGERRRGRRWDRGDAIIR